MIGNAGTHPAALGQGHDVEAAVTLSVSSLVQTKALALSDAFNELFLCVVMVAPLLNCMEHTLNDEVGIAPHAPKMVPNGTPGALHSTSITLNCRHAA